MAIKIIGIVCAFTMIVLAQDVTEDGKSVKTSEAERGYSQEQIQKGWAYGEDANQPEEDIVPLPKFKGKKDALSILEEMLMVQKEQLKEQKKIREILQEQYDPKPHMIKKADGTKCIANSSADCFEFPLIAEAKRVPVMANYLKNPHDENAVGEWKKWLATYLNHTFDIGKASEYDTAENGSNTFKTDFRRSSFDSSKGYFNVAKDEHNNKLINAFGTRGLKVKIYIGKTPDVDLYAVDQIALFIESHPSLPIELVFADRQSAEIYLGAARTLDFVGKAFSQRNLTKRAVVNEKEFPNSLQATPAYEVSFKDGKRDKSKIIKSGKITPSKLDNGIVEWMIFEKIIDPSQLNDARVWKDTSGFGKKYIEETYGKRLK